MYANMKKNKLSLFQVVFWVYERLEGRAILSPPLILCLASIIITNGDIVKQVKTLHSHSKTTSFVNILICIFLVRFFL